MATGRTGSKRKRGKKKPTPARKKARKAKPKARAKARKPKRKPKPKAKTRPRKPAKKTRARPRAARAVPKAAPPPPMVEAAAMPSAVPAAAAGDDMAARVRHELEVAGHHEYDDTVVAVLASIGRGYMLGSGGPPDWLDIDLAGQVAASVVKRFVTGANPYDADRDPHRPPVLGQLGKALDDLDAGAIGEDERQVMTSVCLGAWRPEYGENGLLSVAPAYVVRVFLAGLE